MLRPAATIPIDAPRASARPSLLRRLVRWIERGLAIFGGLVLLTWLTIDYSVIVSPSMLPTLEGTNVDDGDRIITEKVSGWFRAPRRFEVITFIDKSGEKRTKRVVGLPGEEVQMLADRELLIDGQPVAIPPVLDQKFLRYGNLLDGKPVPCGDGYYVLGDYLKDSDDSRFHGPIAAESIIGRAWLIVGPRERFGWVR